jgi:branched-chain amino acid aminotransferase
MTIHFPIERTQSPKAKPDPANLGFGKYFTDHMFVIDYTESSGWHDGRIVPYAPLAMDPATMVLHYGQAVFEGLKAYRTANGQLALFRPRKNIDRLNNSDERMCIPALDPELGVEAIKALVRADRDWVPSLPGTSLYIRPFIFASDTCLGVRPSASYKFMIILSPVGAYYPQGINPIKIYVESQYVRAIRGGVGFAKTVGNYAASMRAQMDAQKKGYIQVLWLDGVEHKYVEEVGAMNVFFKIAGEVVTPALLGSILPGVTRDSVLQLLRHWGVPASERKISIEELYDAQANGTLEEAFGTGTAAVISPVGELNWNSQSITINQGTIGELSAKLYQTLTGIQNGTLPDPFNWMVQVEE